MTYMKLIQGQINARGFIMNGKHKFKLKKDEILSTTYCREGGHVTHILCYKPNVEPNKRWILWSVGEDDSLEKVAQGPNPLKLEDKIDYIKAIKDRH